jgi:aromatic ring-opening dioxygenase LigB subunit
MTAALPIPIEAVTERIFVVRGHRVMLDSDLAILYGVETRVLVQAVKRNSARFPADFMFALTEEEWVDLRSHSVTIKTGRGQHRKYLPYVFTEHGALMLAAVLNSERAVQMSVLVTRAFVRLRELLATNKELAAQLQKLERRLDLTDDAVAELYGLIKKLTAPPPVSKRKIGFV